MTSVIANDATLILFMLPHVSISGKSKISSANAGTTNKSCASAETSTPVEWFLEFTWRKGESALERQSQAATLLVDSRRTQTKL